MIFNFQHPFTIYNEVLMFSYVPLVEITMDIATITMTQEFSSLQPSGVPAIQPFESETKNPRTQLGNLR